MEQQQHVRQLCAYAYKLQRITCDIATQLLASFVYVVGVSLKEPHTSECLDG